MTTVTPQAFWSQVDVKLDEVDTCWPYLGPGYRTATGHIRIGLGNGERVYVHRHAYFLACGPLHGFQVLHHCDCPPCVSPFHLGLGTATRNVAEREHRNRRTPYLRHAPDHHSSRLTQSQAEQIRVARHSGESIRELAEHFGVSATTVGEIVRNRRYITPVDEHVVADEPSFFSRDSRQLP